MKNINRRRLGLTITACGAVLIALALTALLWPRDALAIVPVAETAAECAIVRDRVTYSETATLTPEQLSALRAALAETALRWDGHRGRVTMREAGGPLYRMIFGASDAFELTDTRAFFGAWRYRLSEADARRLSELLDSFFA